MIDAESETNYAPPEDKAKRSTKPLDELDTMRKIKKLLDAQLSSTQHRIVHWLNSVIVV